jgi:predicted P-loop ATPase
MDTRAEASGFDLASFIAEGADKAAIAVYARKLSVKASTLTLPPAVQLTHEAPERRSEDTPSTGITLTDTKVTAPLPSFRTDRELWDHFNLSIGSGGRPWSNIDNVQRVLEMHPELIGRFSFDEFTQRTLCDGKPWDADKNASDLTTLLQRDIHMYGIHTPTVIEGVEAHARQRSFHPVKDFFDSLPVWDREERLSRLMVEVYGAVDSPYTRAGGRVFLASAVARIETPGCLVRHMVVLEGTQNAGKTSSLHDLFDPWMLENSRKLDTKEFDQDIQGHWCVELAEIAGMLKTDVEGVKATLSRRDDYYRATYGRRAASHPRSCIFVGTTNSHSWQIDASGGTRFLPIACTKINRDYIGENREQLFAEALAVVASGGNWWQVPEEPATEEQDLRHVGDSWDELIYAAFNNRDYVLPNDVAEALKIEPRDRTSGVWRRIADCMERLGYRGLSTTMTSSDGTRRKVRVYRRKQ